MSPESPATPMSPENPEPRAMNDEEELDLYALTVIEIDNAIYNAICEAYKEDSLFGPVI